MSTEFFNDQWRIPSNENQNKVSNYSMGFDGTSSYINISDYIFGGLSSLSISCWYNLDSISTDQAILAKWVEDRAILLYHDAPNGWKFLLSTSSGDVTLQSTFVATINTWQHLAVTYESGVGVKIYLNGVAQSSAVQSGTAVTPSPSEFNIGRDALTGSSTRYFNGQLDQLSIFDYALPATGTNSVATLYGGGTAVTNPMSLSPKPVSYYQLGDQSVDNGANYLVPNNSLDGYVFKLVNPDDGIEVPASTDFNFGTGDFTISMWFKINSFASFPYLFDFRTPPSLTAPVLGAYISTTYNRIQVFDTNAGGTILISGTAGTVLQTGVWYNLILKRSSGTLTSHFNGGSADQTATSTSNYNTTPKLNIGLRYDGINGFDGEMSNFQVFNSALPQTGANSIETIYNGGSPLASMSGFTSLVSWWKLNEDDSFNSATSTWTFNDYAGSNDGTSVSMDSSNLVLSNLTKGTSGYSPYALDFDGVDDYLTMTSTDFKGSGGTVSYSFWVKPETYGNPPGIENFGYFISDSSTGGGIAYSEGSTGFGLTPGQMYLYNITNAGVVATTTSTFIDENVWNHIVVVFNTGNIVQFYKNGSISSTLTGITSYNATFDTIAARRYPGGVNNPVNGELSNFSIFDTALTSTQVTEINNQGRPSDLNTFSGTAPVAWWQLGSNSSFNTNWTCLDEIGTNNAVSAGGMTNDDIVDGVGYSASGLGTSSIDIVGDAPYSTANGLSENMDVLDRTTDVPS